MQVIFRGLEPLREFCVQLRHSGQERQIECLETILAWAKTRLDCDLAALQISTSAGEKLASALLLPCDLVTQWGTRQRLLLLQPLRAPNNTEYSKLVQAAGDYARQNYASSKLGLLCFSRAHQIMRHHKFRPAWEYVLTVPFVIADAEIWLLPLRETELQRYGGEIELPQSLGLLWNCLE